MAAGSPTPSTPAEVRRRHVEAVQVHGDYQAFLSLDVGKGDHIYFRPGVSSWTFQYLSKYASNG